jgi:LacI family transcriptional regulator
LASTLASKKSALFATLFPEPPSSDGYWNKPVLGVNKRISELQQYGVKVQPYTFSQTEPESFAANAEKVLELKPDGVVLAPFYKKEAIDFIEQLKNKTYTLCFYRFGN